MTQVMQCVNNQSPPPPPPPREIRGRLIVLRDESGEIVATRQHRDAGKPGAEHLGSTLGEHRWRKVCDRVKRIMPCLDRWASAAAGVREEAGSVLLSRSRASPSKFVSPSNRSVKLFQNSTMNFIFIWTYLTKRYKTSPERIELNR